MGRRVTELIARLIENRAPRITNRSWVANGNNFIFLAKKDLASSNRNMMRQALAGFLALASVGDAWAMTTASESEPMHPTEVASLRSRAPSKVSPPRAELDDIHRNDYDPNMGCVSTPDEFVDALFLPYYPRRPSKDSPYKHGDWAPVKAEWEVMICPNAKIEPVQSVFVNWGTDLNIICGYVEISPGSWDLCADVDGCSCELVLYPSKFTDNDCAATEQAPLTFWGLSVSIVGVTVSAAPTVDTMIYMQGDGSQYFESIASSFSLPASQETIDAEEQTHTGPLSHAPIEFVNLNKVFFLETNLTNVPIQASMIQRNILALAAVLDNSPIRATVGGSITIVETDLMMDTPSFAVEAMSLDFSFGGVLSMVECYCNTTDPITGVTKFATNGMIGFPLCTRDEPLYPDQSLGQQDASPKRAFDAKQWRPSTLHDASQYPSRRNQQYAPVMDRARETFGHAKSVNLGVP